MVDVFISYARAERSKAEPIRAKLEALGYSVFFDVAAIDAGDEFPMVIDRAVKTAKVVVACWSPLALTRPWCLRECRVAQLRNVLLPVAISPFSDLEVPTEFAGIHHSNLSDWEGADDHSGWSELVRSISRYLAVADARPAPTMLSSDELRRRYEERAPPQRLLRLVPIGDLRGAGLRRPEDIKTLGPEGRRYLIAIDYDEARGYDLQYLMHRVFHDDHGPSFGEGMVRHHPSWLSIVASCTGYWRDLLNPIPATAKGVYQVLTSLEHLGKEFQKKEWAEMAREGMDPWIGDQKRWEKAIGDYLGPHGAAPPFLHPRLVAEFGIRDSYSGDGLATGLGSPRLFIIRNRNLLDIECRTSVLSTRDRAVIS